MPAFCSWLSIKPESLASDLARLLPVGLSGPKRTLVRRTLSGQSHTSNGIFTSPKLQTHHAQTDQPQLARCQQPAPDKAPPSSPLGLVLLKQTQQPPSRNPNPA